MVVEWRAAPERRNRHATERGKDPAEIVRAWIVGRRRFHPERGLREEIARHRDPEPHRLVAETRPDHQFAAWRNKGSRAPQEDFLLRRSEKLEDVEDAHVAGVLRQT